MRSAEGLPGPRACCARAPSRVTGWGARLGKPRALLHAQVGLSRRWGVDASAVLPGLPTRPPPKPGPLQRVVVWQCWCQARSESSGNMLSPESATSHSQPGFAGGQVSISS